MLDDEAKLLHAALDDERTLVRSKTAEIRELHSRLRNLEVLADKAGQARLEVIACLLLAVNLVQIHRGCALFLQDELSALGTLERTGVFNRYGAEEAVRSVDALRGELLESRRKMALADHGLAKLDEDRRVRNAELVDMSARLRDSEAEARRHSRCSFAGGGLPLSTLFVSCLWYLARSKAEPNVRLHGSKSCCESAIQRKSIRTERRSACSQTR